MEKSISNKWEEKANSVDIPIVGNRMQTKVIWKRKEWHFILIKVSIKENITILYILCSKLWCTQFDEKYTNGIKKNG